MAHIFQTDAYFKSIPKTRSASMFVLREMIFDVFPNVQEILHEGIPTYIHRGTILCALANHSNYMVLYVKPYDLLLEFETQLENYNWHRSSIRFDKIENTDILFFEELLYFVGSNYDKSGHTSKMFVPNLLEQTAVS